MIDEQNQPLTKRQRRVLKKEEQARTQAQRLQRKKITKLLVIVLSVVVIGGVGYLIVNASNKNGSNETVDLASESGHNPYLGSDDASVVITEFSDFSCLACAAVSPTVKQLASEYSDQLKIVYNGFNLQYRWSEKSLEAGECAFQLGGFWPFHDMMFANQSEWVSADDAVDKFKSYAKTLGINEEAFNNCLDSGRMSSEVARDTGFARSKKVNSTPTFFINDQKLVAVSYTHLTLPTN